MSSMPSRTTHSRSNSVQSKRSARVVAQTTVDAKLNAEFEESERQFDYSASLGVANPSSGTESSGLSSYPRWMHCGELIQPFGCLIAIEESTFAVIAYSENAPEMLDLTPHAVPSIEQRDALTVGTDLRTLFQAQSVVALQKAAIFGDINLLNPILVHCRNSGKPFYAIMHRIDVGLVIDFEPVNPVDSQVTAAGAFKSYKLAAKTISRLQSLPTGNIPFLCDVLVREVGELTGYDRVMAYKFHEDEHGEVVAECRRMDLESYLGLHYPATDIPQASRFLFMKNKLRMICDCSAPPVKVIRDKKLDQPLCLGGSSLRAPHGCHGQYMANMGSIASLVMSVTINEDDNDNDNDNVNDVGNDLQQKGRKLWGLVVCHHTSPRFVPFPLRYACEILLQVFGIQLNKEVELASQTREKHILKTQAVLCDMLLRDAPVGIFTQTPNVMDLVKCDGAALYYRNQFWLLGVTPSKIQIRDIALWLLECHDGTMGLSTDSLVEAGCPGVQQLGDAVCGMAAIKITNKDFLFWFRSHTAKEIKWGGAKNDPTGIGDSGQLLPRSSFNAFLEVVKQRSLPWKEVEMDAIHSLQLILRDSLQDELMNNDTRAMVNTTSDHGKRVQGMDELQTVANEIVRLIETATVPVLAIDALGNVNGWNIKAAELTGLTTQQAIGVPLINLLEDDSDEVAKNMLSLALQGKEEQNVELKLKRFGHHDHKGPVFLVVNACCSRDVKDNIVGVCFVAQDVTEQKLIMDTYACIQSDYISIIRSPGALIPPIFIVDEYGTCIEWNAAMQKLTGLKREDAINKILVGEVFSHHSFGCQVKDLDTMTELRIVLNGVTMSQDSEKLLFGFFDMSGKYIESLLSASKRTNSDGNTTGVLCFLHVPSPELQHAMKLQRILERSAMNSLKDLEYIREEIRKPLHGIVFIRNLMEGSDLTSEQKQILKTSTLCQEQLAKILDDTDLARIEECYMEMNTSEFNLGEALEAVMCQGFNLSRERKVPLVHDSPLVVSAMHLYGDNLRLQQVLSDFLLNALHFTPPSHGSVMLRVIPRKESIGSSLQIAHLEIRIAHPAPGIPDALIQEMFHHSLGISREGLGLFVSQKLVKNMNGTVQYVREAESSSFIILLNFPLVHHVGG